MIHKKDRIRTITVEQFLEAKLIEKMRDTLKENKKLKQQNTMYRALLKTLMEG